MTVISDCSDLDDVASLNFAHEIVKGISMPPRPPAALFGWIQFCSLIFDFCCTHPSDSLIRVSVALNEPVLLEQLFSDTYFPSFVIALDCKSGFLFYFYCSFVSHLRCHDFAMRFPSGTCGLTLVC